MTCIKVLCVSVKKTGTQLRSRVTTGKSEVPKSLCSLSLLSVDRGKGKQAKTSSKLIIRERQEEYRKEMRQVFEYLPFKLWK